MSKRILCALILLAAARPPLQAQQRELRAAAAPNAVVTIVTENADIRVTGVDAAELVVYTRGRARGLQITGDRSRLRVVNDDDEDLEVRVPRTVRLELRTQTGDLSVADLTGSIYMQTLSGDARVSGEPQLLEVESVSGDISLRGRSTTARLTTVSGDIDLPRAAGDIDASSTSGDINVVAEGLERGSFSATSGKVVLQGRPARSASLNLDSASGTLELHLGRDYPADYEIWTVTGTINNSFGPTPTRFRRDAGTTLRFNTGTGARVRASSVSGSVTLRE